MLKKNVLRAALASAVLSAGAAAHAEVPAAAVTPNAPYRTDVVTAITALMVAGISIFAIKKLGSKMGWL